MERELVKVHVKMESFPELYQRQEEGLREIVKLWKEIGFDDVEIRNLRKKDKLFEAGALGNFSLAGFEMVRMVFTSSFKNT